MDVIGPPTQEETVLSGTNTTQLSTDGADMPVPGLSGLMLMAMAKKISPAKTSSEDTGQDKDGDTPGDIPDTTVPTGARVVLPGIPTSLLTTTTRQLKI